jgi:hypothetical protein
MASERPSEREILREALRPGKNCLPVEKLELCVDAAATPRELAQHLESCAYCRAELDLLRSFCEPVRAGEAEAVRMVAERLHSPRIVQSAAPAPWWKSIFQVRWLSPAAIAMAGVLIAIAVGIQWRHSVAPQLHAPGQPEEDVLRSGSLSVMAPAGDLQTVPDQIRWQTVPGAARYQVRLLEVDHAELWNNSTAESQLDIPPQVRSKIVPAKTLLLHVLAFDSSGRKVAESELVRFRLLQKVYTR